MLISFVFDYRTVKYEPPGPRGIAVYTEISNCMSSCSIGIYTVRWGRCFLRRFKSKTNLGLIFLQL